MDKVSIISTFVTTHIVKHKRDRSLYELTKKRASFVDKLNHGIPDLFNENRLIPIDHPSLENITSKLKITSKTPCYIISHNGLREPQPTTRASVHKEISPHREIQPTTRASVHKEISPQREPQPTTRESVHKEISPQREPQPTTRESVHGGISLQLETQCVVLTL